MHMLVLLRHAKADNPERHPTDVERPLTGRGRRDAAASGQWLLARTLVPDRVLCSPAVRARQTWQEAAAALGAARSGPREAPADRGGSLAVAYEPLLYSGGVDDALELIRLAPHDVGTLLVIGHNPTLSLVSDRLDPRGGPHGGLQTAGIAVHSFDGDWGALDARGAPLMATHTARAD